MNLLGVQIDNVYHHCSIYLLKCSNEIDFKIPYLAFFMPYEVHWITLCMYIQ